MSGGPLGVGFIGAGAVTQAIHLPTLARLTDQFRVQQIFDVVSEVATSVAARVGSRSTTSLEELLADEAVDVVAVCSPHHLHAVQVIAACRAGKRAVLCEKPFAMTADEAAEVTAVASSTGTAILVGAMHTFDPAWRAAVAAWKDLPATSFAIRSSIVLPPNARFVDFSTEVISRGGGFPPATDVEAQAMRVHGAVLGLAIHDLPLVRALLPTFDDLEVLSARFLGPIGYHIVLGVGGKRVELHGVLTDTWQPAWTFEAIADDQRLVADFTPSYVHAGSAVASLQGAAQTITFGPYRSNGYEAEWQEMAEIVRGERPAPATDSLIEDLRFAIQLADAAADMVRDSESSGVAA